MSTIKSTDAINIRYSALSTSSCCLSCGGAVNYARAQMGEVCLDLGSGRGNDVFRLAEAVGNKGYVYGMDISDGMLEKAKKTAQKLEIENVAFLKTRLEEIPLEDNSLDLIISNCTMNHAENKQAVWNEIFRVLKNGGRFVVSDIYSSEKVPEEYANDLEAIAECWAGSVTKEEYLKTLRKAGFLEVLIHEESEPYVKGAIKVSSFTLEGIKSPGLEVK